VRSTVIITMGSTMIVMTTLLVTITITLPIPMMKALTILSVVMTTLSRAITINTNNSCSVNYNRVVAALF
jgi:hypothetical protein